MSSALRRLKQRKKSLDTISNLMTNPGNVIVIHYSCESFYGRLNGSSPRITSIAVRNLESGQTNSFSIHQMAEIKKISHSEIEENYDLLEKLMLDKFYDYVHTHTSYIWLHWNMRDSNYGFAAIAHRYEVLDGKPEIIHESKLVDLAQLLPAIYGIDYIEHPRMEKLASKNGITDRDFLGGANEAKAFEEKEYVKLHQSTLRKVNMISDIIERIDNGSLKTNSTWKNFYRRYPEAFGDFLKENWIISILTFISSIGGIIALFVWLLSLFK